MSIVLPNRRRAGTRAEPRTRDAVPSPPAADITQRLFDELGGALDRPTVARTVQDCLHDLQGSPGAARVVGLEHLARLRLRQKQDPARSSAP